MTEYLIKRAYEPADTSDGYRVLVDRIWPRGISKEELKLDDWQKEVAPSTELRKWFDHDPEKYAGFKKRYETELKTNGAFADAKRIWQKRDIVTLVYSAHDERHNQAVVLRDYLSR